jgi:hypothetical protein
MSRSGYEHGQVGTSTNKHEGNVEVMDGYQEVQMSSDGRNGGEEAIGMAVREQ